MDQILEKLLLANIKGIFEIWKIKKSLPSSLKIFHSAYTQYAQNNPISPNKGPTKFFFNKTLTFVNN
jgi:hypothetical protein